jgi:geranylgeranylglycerol-phosphate geranylgeranyltransferase
MLGLVKMARLNTLPMGASLVAFGAYGARHVPSATASGSAKLARLLLGVSLTVIVTTGSMLINDYHDYREGVDTLETKPGRPLVTGQVRTDTVKLVLKWAYALHLTLLCLIDSALMRLWVLSNTLLTYLYSVHLKPITGVKNLVCATIVAMGLGLGAVAQGGGGTAPLRAVWRPMAAVAGLIWHREILMDISDVEGDALVGVRTVPVVFGTRTALRLSLLPLAAAVAAAASVGSPLRAAVATAPLLAQAVSAVSAGRRGLDPSSLEVPVEWAPYLLLVTLLALTSV